MTTLAAYLDRTADLSLDIGTTPMPGISVYLDENKTSVKLRAWYATAIDWCHEKLSERDFTANPPDACVLGVYEFVRVLRDHDGKASTVVKKTKTGAREEEYFQDGAGGIVAAGIAAWPYLEPYVEDVTLLASGGA